MKMYYGVVKRSHLLDIAKAVCDALGHGNGHAVALLLETTAAETLLGEYKDTTDYAAGTGLTQVDEGTFVWLQEKYGAGRHNESCKEAFDIDLSKVQYRELEHNPLLAMIWCRLRYMTVPAPIPTKIDGRAAYWKEWYNSSQGKGSAEEYLIKCANCDVLSLISLA